MLLWEMGKTKHILGFFSITRCSRSDVSTADLTDMILVSEDDFLMAVRKFEEKGFDCVKIFC